MSGGASVGFVWFPSSLYLYFVFSNTNFQFVFSLGDPPYLTFMFLDMKFIMDQNSLWTKAPWGEVGVDILIPIL